MPFLRSVVINSYNYGRYVCEAVDSVLAQSSPATEIIVVDDGSTDDTPDVLQKRFGDHPFVRVIRQRNGGHGMALVAGLAQAQGDLIFFLDADDKYEPDHLENVTRVYTENKDVDFVYTALRRFGGAQGVDGQFSTDRHLGYSTVLVMTRMAYVGGITSTLSMRRNLALTLLPVLQREAPRWRMSADDCLVYGSSLAGARKYFLAAPTVLYRIHGSNHYFDRSQTDSETYLHGLRRQNSMAVFCDYFGVRPDLALQADVEFRTIEKPTDAQYREYRALIWALKIPLLQRLKMQVRIYLRFKGRDDPSLRSLLGSKGKAQTP
jgi:glycosyltransferase involved in cell wall biosynthesis